MFWSKQNVKCNIKSTAKESRDDYKNKIHDSHLCLLPNLTKSSTSRREFINSLSVFLSISKKDIRIQTTLSNKHVNVRCCKKSLSAARSSTCVFTLMPQQSVILTLGTMTCSLQCVQLQFSFIVCFNLHLTSNYCVRFLKALNYYLQYYCSRCMTWWKLFFCTYGPKKKQGISSDPHQGKCWFRFSFYKARTLTVLLPTTVPIFKLCFH